MKPVFVPLAFAALCGAAPAFAHETKSASAPQTYIAIAMADGPTADDRIILSFRGTSPNAVVLDAVRACYERAAPGYMHTCQVSYGEAWVVGTVCAQTPTTIKFAIGDDRNSPEAAKAKAMAFLRDVQKADVSDCRVSGRVQRRRHAGGTLVSERRAVGTGAHVACATAARTPPLLSRATARRTASSP